jgi:hypothetical protein
MNEIYCRIICAHNKQFMSKFGFMKQSFYIGMINCIIDWKFLIKFIIQYRQSDIMFWIWLTYNLGLLQKGFNWSSAIQYCLTLHTLVNSKWKLKSKCNWNTLIESHLLNQFPKRQKGKKVSLISVTAVTVDLKD